MTYLGDGKMVLTYFYPSSDALLNNSVYNEWRGEKGKSLGITTEIERSITATLLANPYNGGSFMRYSNDYGKTWSEEISTGISAPHGVTLLNSGHLMYIGGNGDTIYKSNIQIKRDADTGDITELKQYSNTPIFTLASLGYGSIDDGYYLCEPHAIQLESGRILVATRTQFSGTYASGMPTVYGNYSLTISYSDDNGKTWNSRTVKTVSGAQFSGAPAHLLEITPGVIVLTYSVRDQSHNGSGQYARISYDGGKTWSDEAITLSTEQYHTGDLGYPATALIKEEGGTYYLATVYYQHYGSDTMPSILCTRWNLH